MSNPKYLALIPNSSSVLKISLAFNPITQTSSPTFRTGLAKGSPVLASTTVIMSGLL